MSKNNPYPQKFRQEWKSNSLLKDWLEETDDKTLAKCKFCKSTIVARFSDLCAHSNTKKHMKSSEPFSSARQNKLPFRNNSNETKLKCANVKSRMALFICCHCSIRLIDHLTDITKSCFKSYVVADNVRNHRTKCTGLIII